MKLKRILCVLLLVAVVASFTGCAYLDDLRERQAFLVGDEIHWNGAVYKPMPDNNNFTPSWDDMHLNVTLADVPVLLSEQYREISANVSEDGLFLSAYGNVVACYCREDVYDVWAPRMEEPFEPEVLGYYYYAWDQKFQEGSDAFYVLTEEQRAAVETILETVEPMDIGEGWSLNYDLHVSLESASEDLMFRKATDIVINRAGAQYYLTVYGTSLGRETIYQVPEEYAKTFTDIVQKNLKSW